MHPGQVPDHRRQQIGGNGRDHADAQPAVEPVPRRPREVAEFIDRAQDVAGALGDLFAELRQPDLPRAPLEQHAAERFLEFLDLHRQGRLRDRGCFGGASEVAMTCQYVKITQLFERNVTHQNILLQRS